MIILTPILDFENKEKPIIPKYDGTRMTIEEFKIWDPEVEEGIKYEWNNGVIEAEDRMKFNELKIINQLNNKFFKTDSFTRGDRLISEIECYLSKINKVRIPDVCFLSKNQIQDCKNPHVSQIPLFVIEIISPSNSSFEVEDKIKDYFLSGVQIVWCIYPKHKEVKVYKSIRDIKICLDGDICDVGEVIPDFQISVNEIFS